MGGVIFLLREPTAKFWDYIKEIEKYMPFKFDKKCLRLGRSNKKEHQICFQNFDVNEYSLNVK